MIIYTLTGCSFIPKDISNGDRIPEATIVPEEKHIELTYGEIKPLISIDTESSLYTKETIPEEYLDYDFDGDMLTNDEEIQYGTDIYNPDTDGDGIIDYDEINDTKTSPLKWSSRDDNKSDLEYIISRNKGFLRGWTDSNRFGFKTWLEKPEDRLYVYRKVSTDAFNDLETISEAIQIRYFSGKIAVDCSGFVEDVINSIDIYKDIDGVATKVDTVITEGKFIEVIVSDGDTIVLVYSPTETE